MDETGAATPLLEHEDFDWVRALLEREEVHRAQNPSASGDEDTASMELSTGPPVVGQRSSGKRGRGSRSEDSAGTEDADWRSRELDDFDGTGATEDGKRRKIAWTNTEDLVILTCVRRLGTQWPKIAVHLTGRTPDAVRNRWHRLQRTHSLANTEEGNAALDQLLIVAGVLTPEEAASKPSQAPGGGGAPKESGYHYWHSKVGTEAPPPEPKLLASETAAASMPEKSITSFAFMDDEDDGVVKVYVTLEGDLAGVGDDAVDAKFDKAPYGPECSMEVRVRGAHFVHVLAAERLCGVIVPGECKHKVTKKGKLVVTMKKAHKQEPWEQLRSKVQLPFRRGGGGNPR